MKHCVDLEYIKIIEQEVDEHFAKEVKESFIKDIKEGIENSPRKKFNKKCKQGKDKKWKAYEVTDLKDRKILHKIQTIPKATNK